ncbi:hypothetical protein ABB37_01897 [Leptomonas pyrrhocoris]|uniref:C3H1-type domain-containing protein n=1 Tax=Leptomonas pyrrhocoris TaxID=157538 RepID=A0A0M9G6T0_LEPPY|nr:hypothetical protein ABB37_01897 [Leptomonas pyrrhocoris]KPA83627.1 hypothetical protein ABB37_01897 [Leptomonas pyrrhocoris]|eukprot:XP_015662066.1 hypothetical protein ABB37_01897 [Leptomonas pyrrhocoris]
MSCQKQKHGDKSQKRWRKKKSLYDAYLADSGNSGDSSGDENEDSTFEREEYNVGMDVNILIQQTVQNIVQSVCLEDSEGFGTFGDQELICFAAAIKHNSSILSLQIRYLDVSDISLVPLCKALEHHSHIRAIDLSGTRGGEGTSKALRRLVCTNPQIIFLRLEDTIINPKDSLVIEKALQYNAMASSDPNNNPFHLGLLRRIGAMEEKEHKFQEEMQARPWLFGDSGTSKKDGNQKKAKKVTLSTAASSHIGGEICAQFIQGKCLYGSRCKYIHPERTIALKNVVTSNFHNQAEHGEGGDVVSTAFSTATSSRQRLQSRLRPPHFALKKAKPPPVALSQGEGDHVEPPVNDVDHSPSGFNLWWVLSGTVLCCCATCIVYF